MSLTVKEAVSVPTKDGVNVTLIVQFVPAARLEPQLFVWTKSLLLAPSMTILEMLKAWLPEFESVTD